ncbi:hypothetical protein B0A55_00873 [Friedmanniomyces simplex]|uniref:Uncharacterized protein n=1 Tax=Friedmanniomyces simplex TaxID=329884 RepID=A0A4U0Y2Z1_9PEZI|nr:hypothetical protein B0A55_00873 [Friedmanniomyces simplex]
MGGFSVASLSLTVRDSSTVAIKLGIRSRPRSKATYLNKRVQYHAGIWKDTVMIGLMWRREGDGRKSKEYRCPSWSWASQDSSVSYELATKRRVGQRYGPIRGTRWYGLTAKVLEITTNRDELNPYGSVSGGSVILESHVMIGRMSITKSDSRYRAQQQRALSFDVPNGNGEKRSLLGSRHLDDDHSTKASFLCAYLAEYAQSGVFMLLHPPNLGAEQYVRKGVQVCAEDGQDFSNVRSDIEELVRSVTAATLTFV